MIPGLRYNLAQALRSGDNSAHSRPITYDIGTRSVLLATRRAFKNQPNSTYHIDSGEARKQCDISP
jgi:hypothetical protein